MRSRHFLSLAGAICGVLVPIVRLLWRAYYSRRVWWHTWTVSEFHHQYPLYICLGIIAVVLLAILGYVIGQKNDRRIDESEIVKNSNLELSQQATTDPLTGLFNSRAINE